MKIGEVAAKTRTSVATIRYYESEGLINAARRSTSNYRIYDASHVRRLAFIRRCRELDMTLEEVRELLDVLDEPDRDCSGVETVLDTHIDHVQARLAELTRLEQELTELRSQCTTSGLASDCGILTGLGTPGTERSAKPAHGTRDDLH